MMTKKALLFPGQGAQYVSMGEEFASKYPEAKEVYNTADKVLGFKVSDICFYGPQEKLKKTAFTQPAVLTTSMACYKVFSEKSRINPDYVSGHSLGEYTALVVAGSLKFEEAVKLVYKRGKFMEEAASNGKGCMAAILGLEVDIVEKICKESSKFGVVEPVNLNCPGQIVIAGEKEAVKDASKRAVENGARKALDLGVSGPFHSSLMLSAANKLAEELENIKFNDPEVPVVLNWSSNIALTSEDIKKGLVEQIKSPVLWDSCIRTLLKENTDSFIEVGPGKVLSGLVKNIKKEVNIYNVENIYSLNSTINKLEEKYNAS